jgi:hypothetical protein
MKIPAMASTANAESMKTLSLYIAGPPSSILADDHRVVVPVLSVTLRVVTV